ncbi:hypothetical protein FIA58_013915 [Flavobacterium jejuense]|uniref:Uncharacterized protein n=1 Tax=Flavobacterium jejuense TaxID=1544455 RepID=A0ABX0ISN8_9FLAO|nr:hypothetical protein [Flavobacterium jejuense]NHN26777.1 hypothetical protein [Flavobacterium jejuense]
MILSFSTKLNGKETYFVEKILNSIIIEAEIKGYEDEYYGQLVSQYIEPFVKIGSYLNYTSLIDHCAFLKPKLHTIREDNNNRWKSGVNIDFFINVRKKNMFRFAPKIPVVSTQRIFMTYAHSDIIEITVGQKYLYYQEKEQLALNDEFNSYEDFFNYFYEKIQANEDKCFSGKIIHWTDLKY